jgi:hypothetical protein
VRIPPTLIDEFSDRLPTTSPTARHESITAFLFTIQASTRFSQRLNCPSNHGANLLSVEYRGLLLAQLIAIQTIAYCGHTQFIEN